MPRVRATTSPVDYLALILLLIIIITGVVPTIFINLLGHGYDYRTTVAPWFRGLFSGSPDVTAIANAPVVYQVHAASAWLIWAVWPFSRLVARLERPAVVRVAALHRLPQPQSRPSRRTRHQRPPAGARSASPTRPPAKPGTIAAVSTDTGGQARPLAGRRRLSGICTRATSRS